MRASNLIRQAANIIYGGSSPYRAELLAQLEHLAFASEMHESCCENTIEKTTTRIESKLTSTPPGGQFIIDACSLDGGG